MAVALLILGIILFIGLILIHGGAIYCRQKGGVEVEEYSVFFRQSCISVKQKAAGNL